MTTDNNLQFIRAKINHLQNAIMYVNCDGLVKLENDVITVSEVDDIGQLWFVAHHPPRHIEECEQSFPARLHFYRKGINYFVEVSGKATIVNWNYKSNDAQPNDNHKKILVKLAMTNIEYNEPQAKRVKSKIELLLESCVHWFTKTLSTNRSEISVLKKLRQTQL